MKLKGLFAGGFKITEFLKFCLHVLKMSHGLPGPVWKTTGPIKMTFLLEFINIQHNEV